MMLARLGGLFEVSKIDLHLDLLNLSSENINQGETNLKEEPLAILSDLITEAHTNIQKDFENINPIVGVNRKLRAQGIPVDAMTIDCLKTGKRIILLLNDNTPDILQYQFSYKSKDPDEIFVQLDFEKLTTQQLYEWMRDYFSVED